MGMKVIGIINKLFSSFPPLAAERANDGRYAVACVVDGVA
jgi:hypothetical protein